MKTCSTQKLLQVLKILLDVGLILREQEVEHDLTSAEIDGGAEILLQLSTRRVKVLINKFGHAVHFFPEVSRTSFII